MNFLDILIIVPLLWGAWNGFRKGLIIEVVSLLALIVGIFISVNFSHFVGSLIKDMVSAKYLEIIAFAITFLLTVILMFLAGRMVSKFAESLSLEFLNKIGGIVFGAIKFTFILSVLFSLIRMIDSKGSVLGPNVREKSLLYKPVSMLAPAIFPSLAADSLDITLPSIKTGEKKVDQPETIE